jgi:hypothetical protein
MDIRLLCFLCVVQVATSGRGRLRARACVCVCVCDLETSVRRHRYEYFFIWRNSPTRARAALFLRFLDHTMTHHSRQDSSGWGIGPSQRPLPDNTQYSQETHINAPGGIRTRNPSRQSAANYRLRPFGHCREPRWAAAPRKYVEAEWEELIFAGIQKCF